MITQKTQVVSVINFKGGVGKTTITYNLGKELARIGFNTLLVDWDGQGNLSNYSKLDVNDICKANIITALNNKEKGVDYSNVIHTIEIGLDIIPCNIDKESWLSISLSKMARETQLKKLINQIRKDYEYDFILIDNAPSINLDLQNSLVASDYYLIVTEPEIGSADGVETISGVINAIREAFNPDLKQAGILINKVKDNTNLHNAMQSYLHDVWGDTCNIYNTVIPDSIVAGDSILQKLSFQEYKKGSKIALAFSDFVGEFLATFINESEENNNGN